MALDRYGHVMPGQQKQAAQAIESGIGLAPKRSRKSR